MLTASPVGLVDVISSYGGGTLDVYCLLIYDFPHLTHVFCTIMTHLLYVVVLC